MWKIGHRGAVEYAPENTLASIEKAIALGVDGVEFDIQLSKDGIPVVIHDDTLERTTNGMGYVCDFTLAELQKLDAGNGETIPSLAQLVKMVNKRCMLFIELKDKAAAKPVADIITASVANNGWGYEQFYVLAFNHPQLVEIREIDDNINLCASMVCIPVTLSLIAQQAGANAIAPCLDYTSQAMIDDAHKRGLKVLGWTVNTPASIARAYAMKVDGIISDYPDRL